MNPHPDSLANTEQICGNLLSLPIYESLPDDVVSAVANVIAELSAAS